MSDLKRKVQKQFASGELEDSPTLKYSVDSLDISTFEMLASSPCMMCNRSTHRTRRGYRNIGLLKRNLGYVRSNVIPLCDLCHRTRKGMSRNEFFNFAKRIIAYQDGVRPLPIRRRYLKPVRIAKRYDKKSICSRQRQRARNVCPDTDMSLTCDDILNIVQKPCYFCGVVKDPRGLDRISSKGCYTLGNVLPCCYQCNVSKSILTPSKFVKHMRRVYDAYS